MMDPTTIGAISALCAMVGSGAWNLLQWLLQRKKERRTGEVDDRKLLSEDEREFRKTILEDVARFRLELKECQQQHMEAQLKIVVLEAKVMKLEKQLRGRRDPKPQ